MRTTLRRLLSTLGAVALVTTFFTASPGASAEAADRAYPTLNGVTIFTTSVVAGQSIQLELDAADDVGIISMAMRFADIADTSSFQVQRPWNANGVYVITVPTSSSDGTYNVASVTLYDASGKSAYYLASGKELALSPAVPTGPFTHDIDLAADVFTVTGGVDRTAPSITAISMPTRPAYAEDPGVLAVTLDDNGPVKVGALWAQPYQPGLRAVSQVVQGGSGRLNFQLGPAGTHPIDAIEISDAAGNYRRYERDGTMLSLNGPGKHTLNLPHFDVTVKPSTPYATVLPHSKSVRVILSASDTELPSMSGWRVVVNPGNIVRDVKVASETEADIGGLANGTAYTVSVSARSAVGDSKAVVRTVRPMQSTNVFAVADASGDKRVDLIARQPNTAASGGVTYVYPTNGATTFGRRFAAFHANETRCQRVAPGDIYIVGDSEVLCYGPELVALNRDGSGTVAGTAGWSSMRFVDGGQDLTGDGWPDILGVTADGVLKIYQTGSASRIVSTTTLGGGWNAFTALLQVGDFNGDRKSDLVAVDTAGRMWLYPGNGRGGFGAKTQIGSGWGGFGAVLPLRDFNGDGKADIGAITMDGKLLMYPGNGRGGFLAAKTIGTGWGSFL